jgi:hypothetical protein
LAFSEDLVPQAVAPIAIAAASATISIFFIFILSFVL